MAKLNLRFATEIRRRAAAGETQKALAAAFGVTAPSIHACVHGRLYPDQPRPATPRPDRRHPFRERVLEVLRGTARSSGLVAREIAERSELALPTVKAYLRYFRQAGIVERLGSVAETRYRLTRPAGALSAPRGDRPRRLGLRNEWLRQRGPQAETLEEEAGL